MRIALAVLFAAVAWAQTSPAFDIADVRVSARNIGPRRPAAVFRAGRYEILQANMVELIRTAYNVEPENVTGGPSWLEIDRFDVIAKTAPSTSPEAARLMLQALLADRFKLVVHKDTRPLPAFVLTLGKGKPKLKEADGSGGSGCRPQPPEASRLYALFICRNVTMEVLVARLRQSGGAYFEYPVVDSTGLKGTWDFEVGWTPRLALQRTGEGVSVFEAVEKQLGLKLEQQNVPTPVIVVDRANETPTDNPPGVTAKLPPPPPTEFEVADLKLSSPGARPAGGFQVRGGSLDLRGFPLQALITLAWDIPPGQELGGAPKWLDSISVDLVAKVSTTLAPANGPIPLDDLRPMLRTLLTERFKMKTHYEDRPVTAYTLAAVKPKLQKADPANRTKCKTERAPATDSSPPLLQAVCKNMTMAQFAGELPTIAQSYLHYLVPDGTGIEGAWDFAFSFSVVPPGGGGGRNGGAPRKGGDPAPSPGGADAAPDPSGGISLFDALTRQLGLKLEMQKRSVPVFTIDRMEEKPTDN
jgi:uncharacterized protein (TIGR03435 family)